MPDAVIPDSRSNGCSSLKPTGLQVFRGACQAQLDRMPTTSEQDERLLRDQPDLTQRMTDALRLRLGLKRLLQGCLAQADAALFFLDTVQEAAAGMTAPRPEHAPLLHSEL